MRGRPIRIGTRGSALALAQAGLVEAAFVASGEETRVVVIETAGDRRAPDTAWGEGAFVAAIERALLGGTIDVAVHSAKDIPTDVDPRLAIAAYLPRADPRDALVVRPDVAVRSIDDLPIGCRVGTDSPRRTGFLRARRPDLEVHPLHGNVDTRLRRLDAGETDALVIAVAGLERLGRTDRICQRLDPAVVPPAPGQGAIAVQIRADDARLASRAAAIDDAPTRLAVDAERLFLTRSGGGCRAPIGASATVADGELSLVGGYARPDGSAASIERRVGPVEERDRLVDELVRSLVEAVPDAVRRARRPRVLVTRPVDQSAALVDALDAVGLDGVVVPTIAIVPRPVEDVRTAIGAAGRPVWVVVTSTNAIAPAIAAIAGSGDVQWAAVGSVTARALGEHGIADVWLPATSSGSSLGATLPIAPGDRVAVVRAERGDPALVSNLEARGAVVSDVVAYRTVEAPGASSAALDAAVDAGLDLLAFASGSAVRGLVALAGPERIADVRRVPAVAIGPSSASVARGAGFDVVGVAPIPGAEALARTAAGALASRRSGATGSIPTAAVPATTGGPR